MTTTYTYIQIVNGGVGLVGTLPSGYLLSSIFGDAARPIFSSFESINAFIHGKVPTQSGDSYLNNYIMGRAHTESNPFTYVQLAIGGAGIISSTPTPDLRGALIGQNRIESGEGNLQGVIRVIGSGTLNLNGYIRSATSGSLDIGAAISGCFVKELIGCIRAKRSDYTSISGFIEPIPPIDLYGSMSVVESATLSGNIESVEPVDISGTLIAIPKLDLLGSIHGYSITNLEGSIYGINDKSLLGLIQPTYSGYNNINGTIRGVKGQKIPEDLYAYIIPSVSGSNTISGVIYGILMKDLFGVVYSNNTTDLMGNILGDIPGGLSGTILSTGDITNIEGFIKPNKISISDISSLVSGNEIQDLKGQIESNKDILIGSITTSTGVVGLLDGLIVPTYTYDISGTIISEDRNILTGLINSIEPTSLLGIITPKVIYIDSYIPINTYNTQDLLAVINSDYCDYFSQFNDLSVIINGISSTKLEATIIATHGQYCITSDLLEVSLKNNVELADWIFLIADQPAIIENYLPIILTNSPLSDLYGYIEGIRNSTDITATITSKYIPPVARQGVEIGEWVNTKTGERKLLKINFIGEVENFYYSSDGNKVYPENSTDYLELVVETYLYEGSSPNSLLARKISSKKSYINKLNEFKSIDEAIRFGIICAAGEIHTDLQGYIKAVGTTSNIFSTISGINPNRILNLSGNIVSVTNDPILSGNIESLGRITDISGFINSFNSLHTCSIVDINGILYYPILKQTEHGYSIVLTTSTLSGNLSNDMPDLTASITAIKYEDLNCTLSGSL